MSDDDIYFPWTLADPYILAGVESIISAQGWRGCLFKSVWDAERKSSLIVWLTEEKAATMVCVKVD